MKGLEGGDVGRVSVSSDGVSFTPVLSITAAAGKHWVFYDLDLSGFPHTSGFTLLFENDANEAAETLRVDAIEIAVP